MSNHYPQSSETAVRSLCQTFSGWVYTPLFGCVRYVPRIYDTIHTLCYQLYSGFLFLRFFAAAILTPKLFCLSETYPNERASRSLTLLAKLVQSVANLTTAKESYMRSFDDVITDMHGQLRSFIDRLIDVPDERNSEHRVKWVMVVSCLMECLLANGVVHRLFTSVLIYLTVFIMFGIHAGWFYF